MRNSQHVNSVGTSVVGRSLRSSSAAALGCVLPMLFAARGIVDTPNHAVCQATRRGVTCGNHTRINFNILVLK